MIQLLLRLLSTAGTIIGAGSVLHLSTTAVPVWLKWLLIGIIALAVVVTVSDIHKSVREQPKRYAPQSPEIQNFMKRWLSSGGRAAVFSRDLSWANERQIAAAMQQKARKGELVIFAGRTTDELMQLHNAGAEVHNYESLGFVPRSRFTIVDFERAGARLAIGFTHEGKHVIYEYGTNDLAVMALAEDLVRLARKAAPQEAP